MTRFQNNIMPAAGRAAPRGQSAWSEEVVGGTVAALNTGMIPMGTMSGGAGARMQPSVMTPDGRTISAGSQLDMHNSLPADMIEAPTSRDEAYLGSLKAMLAKNVGNYIVATFLVGTQNMVSWDGILYDVGNDYLTIYQENRNRYVVSDYYSLKFMEFYDLGHRQEGNGGMTAQGWAPAMG